MVGNVAIGSEHPIRIQTMTTSDTKDVTATVEEVLYFPFCFSSIYMELLCFDPSLYIYGIFGSD